MVLTTSASVVAHLENLDSVEINNTTHISETFANQLTQTIYSSNFGSVSKK